MVDDATLLNDKMMLVLRTQRLQHELAAYKKLCLQPWTIENNAKIIAAQRTINNCRKSVKYYIDCIIATVEKARQNEA